MKAVFIILVFFLSNNSFSQKPEFLGGINIDSSITLLGMGQGYSKTSDSLERFWFILDRPEQIQELKDGLDFKRRADNITMDDNLISIGILKDKKLIRTEGVFYPMQKKLLTNGKGWYYFDTALLVRLHSEHPLKYHAQKFVFDTYLDYSFFQDSIEKLNSFLYLEEPNLRYEGKFSLIVKKDPETSSPIFAERDLKKELAMLMPEHRFHIYTAINDRFNMENKDKVKIMIECPRSLYDKYLNNENLKGEWQPNTIEAKVFFRD